MDDSQPHYSLAPGLGRLGREQITLLEKFADYFAGRGILMTVVNAVTTPHHHVFELKTSLGPVLVLERHTT